VAGLFWLLRRLFSFSINRYWIARSTMPGAAASAPAAYATQRFATEVPEIRDIALGHAIACHHPP
jgi:hypothetical protein